MGKKCLRALSALAEHLCTLLSESAKDLKELPSLLWELEASQIKNT
jgi:hypothetical protein